MSSDAALKLVACQVAVSSPKLKAMKPGKDVCMCGCFMYGFAHMMSFSFYPFLSYYFFSPCVWYAYISAKRLIALLFVKTCQNGGLHIGKENSFSVFPCFVNFWNMPSEHDSFLFILISSQGNHNVLYMVYQHTTAIALAKWLDYLAALIRCMLRILLTIQAFIHFMCLIGDERNKIWNEVTTSQRGARFWLVISILSMVNVYC